MESCQGKKRSPQPSENVRSDCCLVLHISSNSLHSFLCKVPQKVYCGRQDDTGRTTRHFAHNKCIQKNSLSSWIKWKELLSFITVSWSDATELGIQKSVLKALTSALSYSKTQTEELHSFLPRGSSFVKAMVANFAGKRAFSPVQTYSLSFDFHTVSSNTAR